jgi:hypothetical protein
MVNKGFVGLKGMLKKLLDEAKASGGIKADIDTSSLSELIFQAC